MRVCHLKLANPHYFRPPLYFSPLFLRFRSAFFVPLCINIIIYSNMKRFFNSLAKWLVRNPAFLELAFNALREHLEKVSKKNI